MEWKSVFTTIGVICCLFFGIPIKIKKQNNETEKLFQSFVHKYNKSYLDNETEYSLRYQHFQASLEIINQLNANRTEGSAEYGITHFCDMSQEEFEQRHLRRRHHDHRDHRDHRDDSSHAYRKKRAADTGLPEKFDWRTRGVVTSVRNQKLCGACWAFSTVETIETMDALKNRTLKSLSVQQVIDCAKNGNSGCDGGDSRLLLEWLLASKIAIEPEKQYPYTQVTDTCRYKPGDGGVQIKSFSCKNMLGGEEAMLELLATHGPVAVAVNAANWQFYLGGVIQYHCLGGLADLNHAVQVVGYVNSGVQPYYIIRNSWGVEFGDKGYLYLSIGSNMCGVANEVCSLDVL